MLAKSSGSKSGVFTLTKSELLKLDFLTLFADIRETSAPIVDENKFDFGFLVV